jgi:hypothetical protein
MRHFGVGYRNTAQFSRGDDLAPKTQPHESGATLGMAMSTSGAAASSSMGHNSTAALALLLTVFNVRLGRWVGNTAYCAPVAKSALTGSAAKAQEDRPTMRGWVARTRAKLAENVRKPWTQRSPWWGLHYLISELFGSIDNRSKFVYLSDGGHFENLGLYELVRRRCKVIVVSSCGKDSDYVFDDLSNAIRLCNIDFGVPIEIEPRDIKPNEHGVSQTQCVTGRIRYSVLDGSLQDGLLIYLKPAITERTSVDIRQYRSLNPDFPQESTADQWYSESQFESYRKLGLETARDAFSPDAPVRIALDRALHGAM